MSQIKFGTDGWRGKIDQDFNQENVEKLSQAVAEFIKSTNNPSVVIGYDMRNKAEVFSELCACVLAANGIKVYLANKACPTPATGFAIINKKTIGGIMFTASHNPPEFLGFKYMNEESATASNSVTDQFMNNLEKVTKIKKEEFESLKSKGLIEIFDPSIAYDEQIKKLVNIDKIKKAGLKILFNPMFGSGQGYLTRMLSGGKTQVEEINDRRDVNFGGVNPEPIVEKNILDQIELMKSGKYDVGVIFDGDADRIGMIDGKGNFISSLKNFLLLAYYHLEILKSKDPIVRTLTNTVMVDNLAKKYGVEVFEVKVGFKYVAEKMKEVNAVFGGEESGGSGFRVHIPARDSMLATLYIIDLIVKLNKPLSEIMKIAQEAAGGLYEYKRVDIHMPYEGYDKIKDTTTKKLVKNPLTEILSKKVVRTRSDDGIKFIFDDNSWLLIRFSGTEPLLRTYAEAKSMEEVDQLLEFARELVK